MAINWVGKQGTEGRVGRGCGSAPVCETRWIVPVRPYQAPKGSWERIENAVLMGAGVAAVIIAYVCLIAAELGA